MVHLFGHVCCMLRHLWTWHTPHQKLVLKHNQVYFVLAGVTHQMQNLDAEQMCLVMVVGSYWCPQYGQQDRKFSILTTTVFIKCFF